MRGRLRTLPLSGETMRNKSSTIFSEIPASGHFVRDALSWNKCSNGTCRSPGRRATLESFLTAYGPRRSLPTSSSSVGTHSVGSPRNLGFWLFRKNIVFSRRSRLWRQGSPLQWYSQPGKPKYHLKKSFGPWRKELLGCPFFPELIAPRKGGIRPKRTGHLHLGDCPIPGGLLS